MSARMGMAGPPISARHGLAFSPSGHRAASVGIVGEHALLETWYGIADEVERRTVPDVAVDRDTNVLPLDDGSVILLRRCAKSQGRHVISVHDGDDGEDALLGSVTAAGGYLLPGPEGALAVSIDATHSTLWRLRLSPPEIEPILRLPGVLSGGAWIDQARGQLGLNQTPPGGRSHGIVVDLSRGAWRCVWSVSEASTDRIVLYAPASRMLVVSTNAAGEPRLGVGVLGAGAIRFPGVLHRSGYPRHVLAADERGERLLVHEATGAVSRLFVYTPSEDQLTPLSSPRGVISSPACWTGDVLRAPFSCPSRPPAPTTALHVGRSTPRWFLPGDTAPIGAELIKVTGAEEPAEAVAYGGPNWRYREQVVVALHGGPLSAWRFEFNPLFQHLASTGFGVVAPNFRGSTGYGPERALARGGWGGPDLEDVRAFGRELTRVRAEDGLPAPIVLGVSYGAYLALLAACTDPDLWSRCVALAPFLSPSALHETAGDGVRDRIRDLGGLDGPDRHDRDVLQRCAWLRMPLLLVHGSRDERIPVEHSRALRHRLADRADLEYLELATDHAGVVAEWPPHLLHRIEDFCLARATVRGMGRGKENKVPTTKG